MIKNKRILQKNWGNIVASLLCSTIPVHEVMTANGFDDPRYLMDTMGIEEDTFQGREVGSYEHTDRKEIAAKLARYAEKFNVNAANIITAADIAAGRVMNDGEVVVLGYNDMITHKAALDSKDIHLCVDVHADANGQLVWENNALPQGLKKLYFQNTAQDVTHIGDRFLFRRFKLTHVDLSAFTNVIHIGDEFLLQCMRLAHVDLSTFRHLTFIGKCFMDRCENLKRLDLPRSMNVESIEDYFLAGCKKLTNIDLSSLSKVISIGHCFLADTGLTQVDLSAFRNVISIGRSFLAKCIRLSKLDLSALLNVTSLEEFFLSKSEGLIEVKVRRGKEMLVESWLDEGLKGKIVLVE